MWWRLSRTGCGCGGCRHRQDVDVVEVVTQRNDIMNAEVANPYPLMICVSLRYDHRGSNTDGC